MLTTNRAPNSLSSLALPALVLVSTLVLASGVVSAQQDEEGALIEGPSAILSQEEAPVDDSSAAEEEGAPGPVEPIKSEPGAPAVALPPGAKEVRAPAGAERFGARWMEIDGLGGRKLLTAVYWPSGDGPFPVVVLLHGRSGFSVGLVQWAKAFAEAGFVAVTGCWFSGSYELVPVATTSIDCPNGPDFQGGTSAGIRPIRTLIDAARALPKADAKRVGLWGISLGANAALLIASPDGIRAVVADSVPYGPSGPTLQAPAEVARSLAAPVLILHSTKDPAAPVQLARDYERTLRDLGKPVEAQYYDVPSHGIISYPSTQKDALARSTAFLKRYLAS